MIRIRFVAAVLALAAGIRLAGASEAPRGHPPAGTPADSALEEPETDSLRAIYVLPPVEVIGNYAGSSGPRTAASQGVVTGDELALRPLLRPGDVFESIPGMLISQHSGEGKANQYYLRGFNLDHGTDFATTIAGVPVNMPTHAHGQGYTDANFLIPELISRIEYRKGTYSAEDGDFSSAGSARISYRDTLPVPIIEVAGGEGSYLRGFVAGSPRLKSGELLGALEFVRNDGPWVQPNDFQKLNGLVRYKPATTGHDLTVTAMGYDGEWNSTDQVPQRALDNGDVSRFGAIDPTDGGTTYRYGLSAELQNAGPQSLTRASAYIVSYRLDLFSNFTYFLKDAIHGDQFEQEDERVVTGLRLSHLMTHPSGDRELIGVDVRHDNIAGLGLYHTEARQRLGRIREDHVIETSVSPFVQTDIHLTSHLRTVLGVRADAYRFRVESSYRPFSGEDVTGTISPKACLMFGPWGPLELYADAGYGFHSDDARGARFSSRVPSRGMPLEPEHFPVPGAPPIQSSPLLVRTKGAEIGARLAGRKDWSTTASLWGLDIESETVFVGDAGLTAPNRPSRRTGIELTGDFRPASHLLIDINLAYSRARFRDNDPAGDHIPGAVEGVASAGIEYRNQGGPFAGLRLRYFGPRPLIESNAVRSHGSTVLNTQLGYRAYRPWTIVVELLNLLESTASDVDYYYTSRLPGEPAEGIADVHTHPLEPRSIRLALSTGLPR